MKPNLSLALALAAGLLGGLLTRYISPPTVSAQNQSQPAKEIRAQSFTLVDQSNQIAGTFTTEPVTGRPIGHPTQTRIVLRDPYGRELWSAGGVAGIQPVSSK
jgi:hypothetical protein